MIIVTGAGRCGSSLMMQTLNLLGVPLIGNPESRVKEHCLWGGYHKGKSVNIRVTEEQDKIARSFNPKGYWELDVYTLIDITVGKYDGGLDGAVKMMGILPLELDNTKVDKVVYCKRKDVFIQGESMFKLAQIDIEISDDNNLENSFADQYKGIDVYGMYLKMLLANDMTASWLTRETINHHVVYFEDMLENPEETIQKITEFLDIDTDITEAVNNVDKRKKE